MGTAFLLFVICAVTDELGPLKKNPAVNAPFCVAMAIYAIGSAFGFNCGYAGNYEGILVSIFLILFFFFNEPKLSHIDNKIIKR